MGMHVGLVACRTTVVELRRAFAELFPHLAEVESAELATVDELMRWAEARRRFVSAADWRPDHRGTEVVAFWQDGLWAVFTDGSYVLPSDDGRLAALSSRFPAVVSFIVESAGGAALFACFEQGRCRRRIAFTDGEVTAEGDALPEEAGIVGPEFYMEESERLARALGLSSLEAGDGAAWTDLSAVCVVDGTDYRGLPPARRADAPARGEAARPRRPWWKLW